MSGRNYTIDSLRAVAIFFVLIAHTLPFRGMGDYGNHIFFVLDSIGMFDVPLFFVISGYFLAAKLDTATLRPYVRSTVVKLGSMYLFGTACFLSVRAVLLTGGTLVNDRGIVGPVTAGLREVLTPAGIGNLLYYGDIIVSPLWFLTALIFAICLVAMFVALEKDQYILPAAAALHLIGLVAQSGGGVPFPTRDALFFGFFYVALGYHIQSADWQPDRRRSRLYLAAVLVLVGIQVGEIYTVHYLLGDAVLSQTVVTPEYTVTTVLLVLTLFGYALSNPTVGNGTRLPEIGDHAVGVYLLHYPMMELFDTLVLVVEMGVGIDITGFVLWHLLLTPALYLTSLVTYIGLGRAGVVEMGGSHIPRLGRIRSRLTSSGNSRTMPSD